MLEEEGEHLQRRGIGPMQIFPDTVHRGLLRLFYYPRDQCFLGLLSLFLGTPGDAGNPSGWGSESREAKSGSVSA